MKSARGGMESADGQALCRAPSPEGEQAECEQACWENRWERNLRRELVIGSDDRRRDHVRARGLGRVVGVIRIGSVDEIAVEGIGKDRERENVMIEANALLKGEI